MFGESKINKTKQATLLNFVFFADQVVGYSWMSPFLLISKPVSFSRGSANRLQQIVELSKRRLLDTSKCHPQIYFLPFIVKYKSNYWLFCSQTPKRLPVQDSTNSPKQRQPFKLTRGQRQLLYPRKLTKGTHKGRKYMTSLLFFSYLTALLDSVAQYCPWLRVHFFLFCWQSKFWNGKFHQGPVH